MAIVLVDGKEIELAPGERLNGIQVAERAGIDIPRYCWHPGLSVVGQLPHVPRRNGHAQRRDRRDHDVAQARARLPDSSPGQYGLRDRTARKCGRAAPWSKKTCSSTIRSTARSATRPASATCRTTTSSTAGPAPGRRSAPSPAAAAKWGTRSRCSSTAASCVRRLRPLHHPRDQRHQRAVRHQPRQPRGDRRLSGPSPRKQDVGQRGRSVSGRRAR